VDGVDAFEPNVVHCVRHQHYRQVWQQRLPSPLKGEWDTILACEFLEHVPQDDIDEVVELLESVARRRVVFSTPNAPAFREGSDTMLGYNDYEAHLSYIPRHFFRRRGYRVLGAGFGNPANPLCRFMIRLGLASSLHSTVRLLPVLAECIVAVKEM
jgi:hypothetical protein